MRVLVTGGTGFIGYHLIKKLLEKNWKVKCLVRETSIIPEEYVGKIEFITGDLTSRESLSGIADNVDMIFHLAGMIKADNLDAYKKVNTGGTKNLLDSIPADSRDRKIVFVSSMAAVGPADSKKPLSEDNMASPVSNYGRSKYLAEQAVSNSNLKYAIVRPAAVYGPGDEETLSFFQLAAKHVNPRIGFKKRYLSMIHVSDLIDLILKAALAEKNQEIYHAADRNSGYSWQEIISTAAKNINSWTLPVYIPKIILKTAAFVSTMYARISGNTSIFNLDKYNEMKQQYWLISSQKAREQLNYRPKYDLHKGFAETANWYQDQGWL